MEHYYRIFFISFFAASFKQKWTFDTKSPMVYWRRHIERKVDAGVFGLRKIAIICNGLSRLEMRDFEDRSGRPLVLYLDLSQCCPKEPKSYNRYHGCDRPLSTSDICVAQLRPVQKLAMSSCPAPDRLLCLTNHCLSKGDGNDWPRQCLLPETCAVHKSLL